MLSVDPDGDGKLNLLEFVYLMNMDLKSPAMERIKTSLQEIHLVFSLFDIDAETVMPDFHITPVEWSKVMRCMGHQYADQDLDDMFGEIDTDGGGAMSFAEFADMYTGPPNKAAPPPHHHHHHAHTNAMYEGSLRLG